MAEAVVSIVSRRIGEFTIQEAKFLYGVNDQVRLAQTELRLMQGFLKDADIRQREEERVRIWVAEIRDAAYDLEDVIERFVLKVACKRSGAGFNYVLRRFACVLKEGVYLYKIGSDIKSITTKISNLRLSAQTYNIREIRETGDAISLPFYQRQQQLRRTYSHVTGDNVVGLEKDAEELIMHLVNDESCHRVVSIWGMGGLGKTTLAKQVYHHKIVRRHFDCSAWICISQRCKVREVWEGILVKLISPTNEQRAEIEKMKDDEIAKKLYIFQQESRCLVVLDDIWSIHTWDSLKAAFPLNEETKSRMLLTTRNKEVALHSDRNGFLHQPRALDDDESWELFEKLAITGRNRTQSQIYSEMEKLGKRMLQRCGGLPLAITVLAGLLARKDTVNEWETVLRNVDVFISRGKGHEKEYAGVSWVMELSYDDLPYHLKPCFLYLGNYPEDSEINVKTLTQLWIAEGFISSANQREGSVETMEEVAYNWLSELVQRCVVQVGEQGTIRDTKSCRLHDLVRDMCLLKAEEEHFLQILNLHFPCCMEITKAKPIGEVRRLAVHVDGNVDKWVPHDGVNRPLRSLSYFGPKHGRPRSKRLIDFIFKDFKLLRVLRLDRTDREVELPSDIGKMVHLRYLSIRYSTIKRLPSSVANLTCLQTLDFRASVIRMSPNVTWNMKQLRHLYFSNFQYSFGKQQLSALANLQTLHISGDDFDWNNLTYLTSLRRLALNLSSPLKHVEQALKSTSSILNCVQSLAVDNWSLGCADAMQIVLSCRQLYKLSVSVLILELPKDPQYYPNLTKLNLWRCDFKDDQMAILEKLPNLTKFTFHEVVFEKNTKSLVCSKGGFCRLQVLSLGWSNVDDWKVEQGAMPNLCELSINCWTQLRRLPEELRYITTLRKLKITGMRRTDCSRLQQGGEDYYKVQHVRSLAFENIYDGEADIPAPWTVCKLNPNMVAATSLGIVLDYWFGSNL
ncbi:PREDICTED: putative disease resistance protein At1g50180 [Fragaria vesca subsp. vesca]|uniref:putative disease resistance protein At1g50180 n=1 Tax=Fragaria vesca subsp. vesca TaxID=101020 RepID=UPI0002C376F2|nr:PREDICTED: putative disease resistance protein At1g50180 [Fragaria vesca subsp. vesca]